MKIGACTAVDSSVYLKEKGYDYIEMGLSGIAALSCEDFSRLLKEVDNSPLKPYAFNVLFPGGIRLTGPETDEEIIKSYLVKALDRAKALGGEVVVFGSGGARRYPEGFSREEAFSQLAAFLKMAAGLVSERGITIVIEPLRSEETNIVNTAAEGLRLAREVNHQNIRLLVDFYHMACEKESPDIILEAGSEYIRHIHIANPNGRIWPMNPEEAGYRKFFENLRKIGYEGGISIEGSTSDILKDAPLSMNCLRELIGNS